MTGKLIGYTLGVLVMLVWAALSGPTAERSYKGCFGAGLNEIEPGPAAWSEWVRSARRKRQPYRKPWWSYGLSRKRWRRWRRRLWYQLEQRGEGEGSGCRSGPEEERGSISEMLMAMVDKMPAVSIEMGLSVGMSWVWWAFQSAGRWG